MQSEERKTHQVKRDGKLLFTGTEFECFYWLQKNQSASADWAMKYEGYTIEPISQEGEGEKKGIHE